MIKLYLQNKVIIEIFKSKFFHTNLVIRTETRTRWRLKRLRVWTLRRLTENENKKNEMCYETKIVLAGSR